MVPVFSCSHDPVYSFSNCHIFVSAFSRREKLVEEGRVRKKKKEEGCEQTRNERGREEEEGRKDKLMGG